MVDLNLDKAKSYALRLIQYRPRSEKELAKRLADRGFSAELSKRIISDFKGQGLVDDSRFARLWVSMRCQTSPKGPSYIKRELLSKGVEKDIIEQALGNARSTFDEEDIVRQLVEKQMRRLTGIDKTKQRSRIYAFLSRRGFSSDVVYKVLNEAC